VEQAIVDR